MSPKARTHTIASTFLLVFAIALFVQRANADFSGPYAVPEGGLYLPDNLPAITQVGAWTLHESGNYTYTYAEGYIETDSTELIFYTGITTEHSFSPSLDLQFTNTIPADGILFFDYSLSLLATGAASGWNYGGYILDGVLVKLTAGTGSIAVPVKSGDLFGFEAFATVNCALCGPPFNTAGSTALTITNFNAPVPEPPAIALLICGAAGFAAIRHKIRLRRRVGA